MHKILRVEHLKVLIEHKNIKEYLIQDISFHVHTGECLGILGESGSGKSIAMKSILGIQDSKLNVQGSALYYNMELIGAGETLLRKLRGNQIAMVMQHPMMAFDPLYRIGYQMIETVRAHKKMGKKEIRLRLIEILNFMSIRQPEDVLRKYPHQLSGGMLQRVMIGLALILEPDMLIADEPTTAIDAVTQYDIIQEFVRLKQTKKITMVFISHDLGVIEAVSDRIIVMNKGRIVDEGDYEHIVKHATDPYTKKLIYTRQQIKGAYEKKVIGA